MKNLTFIYRSSRCSCCGKSVSNVGSGSNMGTSSNPMCERCWERGGDDY